MRDHQQQEQQFIALLIKRIRQQRPLIHHITNMVVMNDTANITIAIGASPVMAHALEEVEEMVSLASALVLNIGTLTPILVEAMVRAGKRANELGIPIVLDPVGAGATTFRTQSALRLLRELRITIIRGNASEIGTLVGVAAETRGVDAGSLAEDRAAVAGRAAATFGCTIAMTGAVDIIANGRDAGQLALVANGHPLLAAITGSGCMATSLVAACAAIETDSWHAAIAGLVAMGIAGEQAALQAQGPGTFRSHLLDAVALLDTTVIERAQKVSLL
jgi:hydroxyethylthiazole kinase